MGRIGPIGPIRPMRRRRARPIRRLPTLSIMTLDTRAPRTAPRMATVPVTSEPLRWELAAETIAVKIRWFGLLFGYIFVNLDDPGSERRAVLNAILTLGAAYTVLDTYYSVRGRVFLGRYPLFISLIEAVFIGLLCFFQGGLDSAFRYY